MIVVIATLNAKQGSEDKLKDILTALVVESRLEPGNVRYELLERDDDPTEFALYEVWETETALNAHLRSKHISVAYSFTDELNTQEPRVVSYHTVEPTRTSHSSGPTRKLEPTDPQP